MKKRLQTFSVLTFIFCNLIAFFAFPALSQNLDSTSGDWKIYSIMQDGEKICYATTGSQKQQGNYKKRGQPYLLVTHRKSGISEVSVSSGYPYKMSSLVEVKFDGKHNFELFTTQETPNIAWARDEATDKKIIDRMIKGRSLTAKGYSKINTYSVDVFSLIGFTKAYNRIKSLCK